VSPSRRTANGLLIPGILLVLIGVFLLVAHPAAGMDLFALRFWPLFLVLAGLARITGFALGRRPRSPIGGAILLALGIMFLLGTLQSEMTALQIYARYWLALLVIVAAVHLIKYYSHRPQDGPPPRLLGPLGVILVLLIVSSGIAAHRLAVTSPNLVSASSLPALLHGLPAGAAPRSFTFSDSPFVVPNPAPAPLITVSNKFGDVRVAGGGAGVQASLTKTVRGWDEADAKELADHIKLVVDRSSANGRDSFTISTSSDRIDYPLSADLTIQVPDAATLSLSDTYGTVSANRTLGPLSISAQRGQVEVNSVKGNVTMSLDSSDVRASAVDGDVKIAGARQVKLSGISGSLDLTANKGDIDLRDVQGQTVVNATQCHITAQNLHGYADVKSRGASVDISHTVALSVDAPDGDVRAESINGNLNISSSNSAITVHAIAGNLNVTADHSSVTADSVLGGVSVETSYKPVVIKNFNQAVKVRDSFNPVTLVSTGLLTGDIDVETSNGDIKLIMPQLSVFQFEGESQGGHVRSRGFSFVPSNGQSESRSGQLDRLAFGQGTGGPKVVLKTSNRDIILEAKSGLVPSSETRPSDPIRNDYYRRGYSVSV
jgi:DUF4097 and DUF4098 domain-containing protein YvlB